MKCDYHMHPNLINAPGQAEGFIRRAIELGFDTIYFTDHMPLSSSNAFDRIPSGRIGDYCARARELAEQYKGTIAIRTGIEMDYEPTADCLRQIEANLSQGDFDLVLGSTHLGGQEFAVDSTRYDRDHFAEICFRNSEMAVRSGYFDVITHLDAFRWEIEWPERYHFAEGAPYVAEHHESAIRSVLQAAQDCHVRVEVNASMIYKAERFPWMDHDGPHPVPFIMQLAREYALRYTFASDAHEAKYIGAYYDELLRSPVYGDAVRSSQQP